MGIITVNTWVVGGLDLIRTSLIKSFYLYKLLNHLTGCATANTTNELTNCFNNDTLLIFSFSVGNISI